MGCNRTDKPWAIGSRTRELVEPGERRNSLGASLAATLAEHSQRFSDILSVVLDIKATLEPMIIALRIDMGHQREDYKKLKDRLEAMENTVSDIQPSVTDATSHIRALQKEVLHLQQRVEDQDMWYSVHFERQGCYFYPKG
ncbi:hypothetical protein NDU88_002127 [Pleurodeles waltl]|uniref:Uncharacterized protein n=1 Tax=Pleurodeles waltl TaxID=8319 RepID=A0AAV7MRV6_PLEWA|nr:hypothetical protein NDU88_002127 [Pleurodeles waltl]